MLSTKTERFTNNVDQDDVRNDIERRIEGEQ
jgi:hypothetical protein